jgi:hypothetical protein
MTLCQNKEYQIRLHLGKQKGKKIVGDFKGGQITSDAGALLLSGINKKYRITERINQSLVDQRDNRYTEYSLEDLISQRLFQIACGYEDCNDANSLRNDLLFKIITQRGMEENLASQPTLSRLENGVSYKELYRLAKAMVELYLDTKDRKTKKIILDFDITADEVYGSQQLSFFHGYYGEYVYLPLLVFDGETGKLITTILQPGNKWGGFRVVSILKRIVKLIRERFPEVEIVIRADAGFMNPELYEYCETDGIGYIIGLARNERLEVKNDENMQWACWLYRITQEKQKIVGSFEYQADSWSKARRIIAKAEWNEKGGNQRFVVSNLTGEAHEIYEQKYTRRGEECENRIKELKLDLKADRLSCHEFKANQFRLLMHGFAYWLLHLLRGEHLKGTELERAQMGTIRLKLIKIGAQIISRCRRIWIHLSSGYPLKDLFALIVRRIGFSSA